MSPELQTFLIAMSPIIELRGAIPIALKVYGLPVWSAYFFSVLGNLIPLFSIVLFGKAVSDWLSAKCSWSKRFFDWLFSRIGKKANIILGKTGRDLTILILTATPIPLVGGWTGAIAAILLAAPQKRAVILVAVGAMISGIIVTLISLV